MTLSKRQKNAAGPGAVPRLIASVRPQELRHPARHPLTKDHISSRKRRAEIGAACHEQHAKARRLFSRSLELQVLSRSR